MNQDQNNLNHLFPIAALVVVGAFVNGLYHWFLRNEQAIYDFLLAVLELAVILATVFFVGRMILRWSRRVQAWITKVSNLVDLHEEEISEIKTRLGEQLAEIRGVSRSVSSVRQWTNELRTFTKYDEVMEERRKEQAALADLNVKAAAGENTSAATDVARAPSLFNVKPTESN